MPHSAELGDHTRAHVQLACFMDLGSCQGTFAGDLWALSLSVGRPQGQCKQGNGQKQGALAEPVLAHVAGHRAQHGALVGFPPLRWPQILG